MRPRPKHAQCVLFGDFEEETAISSGYVLDCSFHIRYPSGACH